MTDKEYVIILDTIKNVQDYLRDHCESEDAREVSLALMKLDEACHWVSAYMNNND